MNTLADFTLTTIDGAEKKLSEFAGKPVLVVNVASKCGFTPQYTGLEALHEKYAAQGLVVAGVPSNDFGAQEPGTEAEIQSFCTTNYGVKFPMFAKVAVLGDAKHPLYQWLTTSGSKTGDVKWNFEKFLIGKDGHVAGRFSSRVAPDSPELIAAIEAELAK